MHDCTVAEDIHHPQYVADLFDRCAANYRITSAIASFGFVLRWRHQCIGQLRTVQPKETPVVYDLMAGTGEIWPYVIRQIATDARIVAVDISRVMHEHAVQKLHASRSEQIEHVQADVLEAEFPNSVADYVVSTFGLKTMNPAQLKRIAQVTAAMLKPGAQFTFIEASDPKGWMLRPFYRLYMDSVTVSDLQVFLNQRA